MADTVDIDLAHGWEDHKPGDRIAVEPVVARRLVRDGYATYARKDEAVKVEGNAGATKTTRARRRADS